MTKTKEFKPKQPLAFSVDPHNNRGGKGKKRGGSSAALSGSKGGKKVNVAKFKSGGSGDR